LYPVLPPPVPSRDVLTPQFPDEHQPSIFDETFPEYDSFSSIEVINKEVSDVPQVDGPEGKSRSAHDDQKG
jgi:hypothetical protein